MSIKSRSDVEAISLYEASKQALEALKNSQYRLAEYGYQAMQKTIDGNKQALTTLRTAIEQAEKRQPYRVEQDLYGEEIKLYTTPPAAPVQEPVAKVTLGTNEALRVTADGEFIWHPEADAMIEEGDFTSSPAMRHILRALRAAQRPMVEPHKWVGLTEDEQDELVYSVYDLRTRMELAIGIEAKLKEKNT
jgi:hypothetical protein